MGLKFNPKPKHDNHDDHDDDDHDDDNHDDDTTTIGGVHTQEMSHMEMTHT